MDFLLTGGEFTSGLPFLLVTCVTRLDVEAGLLEGYLNVVPPIFSFETFVSLINVCLSPIHRFLRRGAESFKCREGLEPSQGNDSWSIG